MVLDGILAAAIATSSDGLIPSILRDSDSLGPYLQGVEVRLKIGALILENGVRGNSPLVFSTQKPLSLAQNVKYKKIGVRDFSKNVSVVGYDDILSPDTDQVWAADRIFENVREN